MTRKILLLFVVLLTAVSIGSCQQRPRAVSQPDPIEKPKDPTVEPKDPATDPIEVVYEIGDIGPSGGIIFYVDPEENKLLPSGKKYLEAAIVDSETNLPWDFTEEERFLPTGAMETVIGSGHLNTAKIILVLESNRDFDVEEITDYAAGYCASLVVENQDKVFDDFYLPSLDELNAIYVNIHRQEIEKSDFTSLALYWTSSDYSQTGAFAQYFDGGYMFGYHRYYENNVRCIRSF